MAKDEPKLILTCTDQFGQIFEGPQSLFDNESFGVVDSAYGDEIQEQKANAHPGGVKYPIKKKGQ